MATHQVGCLGAQGEGGGGFWSVRFLGVDSEYRGGARPGRRPRGYPPGNIRHTAAETVTYQVCEFPPGKKTRSAGFWFVWFWGVHGEFEVEFRWGQWRRGCLACRIGAGAAG